MLYGTYISFALMTRREISKVVFGSKVGLEFGEMYVCVCVIADCLGSRVEWTSL